MSSDTFSMESSIVFDLKDMLDNYNPFVKAYRMARERFDKNIIPELKLVIIGKRNRDSRRYNLPTVSEVPGGFDSADGERDVIVESLSGQLHGVSILNPSYLPLQYPLLFPRGEDGFSEHIMLRESLASKSKKRQKVYLREFFAYRIQSRHNEESTILMSKRLFQQFLVDAYSMIESSRLYYVKSHQKQLRAEMYKGLADTILRGETDPSTAGERIVLPSSFTGGARYMFQNYQDAMAICSWGGYPDLFITFTCNQK